MEVKINREIRNYTESMFFGLSMRQFIFSVLALVIAVGLGPVAGILALTLHTTGVLARLFVETLEDADPAPRLALQLSGAGPTACFWYGVFPLVARQWLAYSLYRGEMNLRAATILGVVGAGGLGQQLYVSLSLFRYDQTATLLLAPNGTRTLATAFWAYSSEIDYAGAAPYALLMVLLSLPMTWLLYIQSKKTAGR